MLSGTLALHFAEGRLTFVRLSWFDPGAENKSNPCAVLESWSQWGALYEPMAIYGKRMR